MFGAESGRLPLKDQHGGCGAIGSIALAVWLCAFGQLACGDDGDDTTREVLESSGTLCLRPEGANITIEIGMGICLRGRCRYAGSAPTCRASLEGGRILLTSSVEVLSDHTPGLTCPTDCSYPKAVCQVEPPPRGLQEAVVVFGSQQSTINLPLASATPLFTSTSGNPCSPPP
jgi:hypothetical protein